MKTVPSRALLALALSLTLGLPARAQSVTAQLWRELGAGSATGEGLSKETLMNAGLPAMAIDQASGQLYVAWEGGASDIFVKKWTGTEWVAVGGPLAAGISANAGHSRFPAITVNGDHQPVVAWLDDSSGHWEVYLKRFNGTTNTWEGIADSATGGGLSKALGAIASPEGVRPSVAVGGTGGLFVSWAKNGSTAQERRIMVSTLTTAGGWQPLGAGVDLPELEYSATVDGESAPGYLGASQPALLVIENAPLVAYLTRSNQSFGDVHVRRWNGTAWAAAGTGAAVNAGISGVEPRDAGGYTLGSLRLAQAADGSVHAAWIYSDVSSRKVVQVRRLFSGVWAGVGPALPIANLRPEGGLGLALGSDNAPVVSWSAELPALEGSLVARTDLQLKRLVRSTTGDAWKELGLGSATDGGISANPGPSAAPVLVVAKTSTSPTVAWLDGSDPSVPSFAQVYLRRLQPAGTEVSFKQTSFSGTESAGSALISVSRRGDLTAESRVRYATRGGTATAGVDYTAAAGELIFAPGETLKTFPVAILADTAVEPTETVELVLTEPSTGLAVVEPRAALLTITDVPPSAGRLQFSRFDYTVGEIAGKVLLSVNREGGSAGAVSVHVETVASPATTGTSPATAGADFTAVGGTLSFEAGQTLKTFEVPILQDDIVEGSEVFGVVLSNPTGGATLGSPAKVPVTIFDTERVPQPGIFGFATASFAALEGHPAAVVTVFRKEGSEGAVSVKYATKDLADAEHPATAGADYTAASGTLNFAAGQTSQTFSVPITEDTLVEGPEVLGLTLSEPTGGATLGTAAAARMVIGDNDQGAGVLRFAEPAFRTTEGLGQATIRVVRNEGSAGEVSVHYATANGTASEGSDYSATSGTLTLAAGQLSGTFVIPISNDTVAEGPETVLLTLSEPTGGAVLGTLANATLTIDDSISAGTLQFSISEFRGAERSGAGIVTVTRSEGSAGEVGVSYASSDDTAVAELDYRAVSGTLTFAAGEMIKTIVVPLLPDTIAEGPERVRLVLSNPTGGAKLGLRNLASLIIADDDANAGVLQFNATAYRTRESAEYATIGVVRRNGAAGPVSVQFATADGSATAGDDYLATSGVLRFAAGEIAKSFRVRIKRDTLAEGTETVLLSLREATGGAVLGPNAKAVLTIVDLSTEAGSLQFAEPRMVVNEAAGTATIKVTRMGGSAGPVTINYAVSEGSATDGADFKAVSGTLEFADGELRKTFTIPILTDDKIEQPESLHLVLSDPTGGALLGTPAQAELIIYDSTVAPESL